MNKNYVETTHFPKELNNISLAQIEVFNNHGIYLECNDGKVSKQIIDWR